MLSNELNSHDRWQYKGTFTDFEVPELLSTFVKWIIVGPHMSLGNSVRVEMIENAVSIVTELIMQSFKTNRQVTNRQVTYDSIPASGRGFYSTIETPLTVGLGLKLHHETRSKRLDHLARLNLSIMYEKVLRLETDCE